MFALQGEKLKGQRLFFRSEAPGLARLVLWWAGLFSDLSARETCPLHCSPHLFEAGSQGFPHR
jgi:hypothetical protein